MCVYLYENSMIKNYFTFQHLISVLQMGSVPQIVQVSFHKGYVNVPTELFDKIHFEIYLPVILSF